MARRTENVVAVYTKRGTCEQWIKEGKGAIKWSRLSCRSFAANALAYNLGNVLRTLATPEPISDGSMTTLRETLNEIGANVGGHARSVTCPIENDGKASLPTRAEGWRRRHGLVKNHKTGQKSP
eukprot:gene56417-77316_t